MLSYAMREVWWALHGGLRRRGWGWADGELRSGVFGWWGVKGEIPFRFPFRFDS